MKWWVRYVTALQDLPIHRVTALLLFTGLLALVVILILTVAWQFIAYLRVVRNTANRSIGYHDFLAIRTAVLTHAVPTRIGDLKLLSLRVRDAGEVEVWTGEKTAAQDARGRIFRLHRSRGFWEVIGEQSWKM
ncbi:MAG TPA: hypothetical protein VLZ30_10065 [Verrucomicrobiae bacterium]|nr:hypothetical protein [Verrucomicrobiae bacterium]